MFSLYFSFVCHVSVLFTYFTTGGQLPRTGQGDAGRPRLQPGEPPGPGRHLRRQGRRSQERRGMICKSSRENWGGLTSENGHVTTEQHGRETVTTA